MIMQRNTVLFAALVIVLSALVGWINVTASEMQPIVGMVLIAGFVLGAAQPRHAWRWGLLLVAVIVASGLIAYTLGYVSPGYIHSREINPALPAMPTLADQFEAVISIIPAMIAVYLGVAVRKIVEMMQGQTPSQA
jgi:hypothetical protein